MLQEMLLCISKNQAEFIFICSKIIEERSSDEGASREYTCDYSAWIRFR